MTIDPPAQRLDAPSATVTSPAYMVVTPTKSVGIAILLTLIFGPLGLFYASVTGALIVLLGIPIVGIIAVSFLSAQHGNGLIFLLFTLVPMTWIVALIWSVVAVNTYNSRLMHPTR